MKNEVREAAAARTSKSEKFLYVCSQAHSHIGTFFLQKQKMDSTAFPTLNHLKLFTVFSVLCAFIFAI